MLDDWEKACVREWALRKAVKRNPDATSQAIVEEAKVFAAFLEGCKPAKLHVVKPESKRPR